MASMIVLSAMLIIGCLLMLVGLLLKRFPRAQKLIYKFGLIVCGFSLLFLIFTAVVLWFRAAGWIPAPTRP